MRILVKIHLFWLFVLVILVHFFARVFQSNYGKLITRVNYDYVVKQIVRSLCIGELTMTMQSGR